MKGTSVGESDSLQRYFGSDYKDTNSITESEAPLGYTRYYVIKKALSVLKIQQQGAEQGRRLLYGVYCEQVSIRNCSTAARERAGHSFKSSTSQRSKWEEVAYWQLTMYIIIPYCSIRTTYQTPSTLLKAVVTLEVASKR